MDTSLPVVQLSDGSPRVRAAHRLLFGICLVALLIAAIYAYAWYDAYRLTQQYVRDADQNYTAGNYFEALIGFQEYNPGKGEYVTRGGYMMIERIWLDPHAKPVPADEVAHAEMRIDEVVNQHLTIADVELFITQNTGKNHPYLGLMYVRWGELFEAEGDRDSAEEIYSSVAELFPFDPDLIQRAEDNLANLPMD